jgi:hypothetical protein
MPKNMARLQDEVLHFSSPIKFGYAGNVMIALQCSNYAKAYLGTTYKDTEKDSGFADRNGNRAFRRQG